MSRVPRWLAELPASLRWTILGAAAILAAVVIGSGVWTWLERREAAAQRALGAVLTTAHQAVQSGNASELEAAATALRKFLDEHPRSRAVAQGWYVLGDVEFRRRQWDAAVAAFGEAGRRDARSLGALSRLGEGYALEAKGEPARALEAYERGLSGRQASDFLYGDLLLANRAGMGSYFEVRLPARTPGGLALANAALDLLGDLERQLTVYRDDSELSRLNATAHLGPVPVEVRRPPGSYPIVVRKEGYEPYEANVTLRAGADTTLRARLSPERVPITKRWWFWTGAAVVVSGGILATYALTREAPPPEPYDGGNTGWVVEPR